MIVIFLVILAIYLGANYFVALQLANEFPQYAIAIYSIIGWLTLIAVLTLAVRKHSIGKLLGRIGNYWMGLGLLAAVIFGIAKLLPFDTFYIALVITLILFSYGVIHAHQLQVKPYRIQLNRSIDHLHMVLISDVHLGYVNGVTKLYRIVNKINRLKPDIVVISGDLFDSNFKAVPEPDKVVALLNQIKAKHGVYLAWGNHDAGETFEEMKALIAKTQIILLEDEMVEVADFHLVGRKDCQPIGDQGAKRQPTLTHPNTNKAVIVLDHQPSTIHEYDANTDLILSGHTHQGQIFPFNYVTKKLFTIDYGHLQLPTGTQVIVSSGVGFWGPPMRIGTDSEIVSIKISTQEEKAVGTL